MTIDFTKPLVCVPSNIKVVQVIPLKFANPHFRHAVILEKADGDQDVVAVNDKGVFDSESVYYYDYKIQNEKPKVVNEIWQNVHEDRGRLYFGTDTFLTQFECKEGANEFTPPIANTVTRTFSDGTVTYEFIQIKKD